MTERREVRWRGLTHIETARQYTWQMLEMIDRHGAFLAKSTRSHTWLYGYVEHDETVVISIPFDSISNKLLLPEDGKDMRLVEWHKLNMYRNASNSEMIVRCVSQGAWYGIGLTWEEAEEQLGKAVLLSLGIDKETT